MTEPQVATFSPSQSKPPSALAPLGQTVFRWLWIAALASNVGTWIHEVGAGWAMTELAPTPLMVSLIQSAATLPLFILVLPAGALADVADRRQILLAAQGFMLGAALTLALLTWSDALTPTSLLWLTLGLGVGAALANPAWQVLMTSLVHRDQIPAAAALNSVSMNLSRAVGPAIGGVIVSQFGPEAAFGLNAASFVGIICVLAVWSPKRSHERKAVPTERFLGAMRAGVRYARYSRPMHALLGRTFCFVISASALWALMPLLAREQLDAVASGYGTLLGSLGAGAVTAAFILPSVRAFLGPMRLILFATLTYAFSLFVVSIARSLLQAVPATFLCGMGWITVVTTLNAAAQAGSPPWVRARALSCYLTVFFGSMSIGSLIWGLVAGATSIDVALQIAGVGLIAGLATLRTWRIQEVPGEDMSPSDHWESPQVAHAIGPDDGPVIVTVEYRIRDEDIDAFRAAMGPVSETRYRDGAMLWTLSRCTEEPARWIEVFMVESWAEHLRQHDRVTMADKRVQVRASSFHTGPGKPVVRHYIAASVS